MLNSMTKYKIELIKNRDIIEKYKEIHIVEAINGKEAINLLVDDKQNNTYLDKEILLKRKIVDVWISDENKCIITVLELNKDNIIPFKEEDI